jgi:hypothetical protein
MSANMKFLILDRDATRRGDIVTAVQTAIEGKAAAFSHNAGDIGWAPPVPADLKPDLVLFHWSDNHKLTDEAVSAPFDRAAIRIAYSGGGMGAGGEMPEGWLCIPRALSSAEQLTGREWKELCTWIINPERSLSELPGPLRAIPSSARLALRLLCEAWTFTGGADKISAAGKANDEFEITIHAPQSPEDWYKPFGQTPPGATVKAEAKEAALKEISKLMVGAETEAKELLEAVLTTDTKAITSKVNNFLDKSTPTFDPKT